MEEQDYSFVEDYKIIEAENAKELRTKVLNQLDKDFEPQGGVAVGPDGKLYQAMILIGEEGEGDE